MSHPNLGEDTGDMLSSEALESKGDSSLIGVVADFVGTRWPPISEFKGSDDSAVNRIVEGRTFVREAVFTGSIPQALAGTDTSEWEGTPHSAEPDAPSALQVALQMKAVRAIVLGLVGVATLLQLNYGIA